MNIFIHGLSCWLILMTSLVSAQPPRDSEMLYLDNEQIKVGIDLKRGGSIVYLSRGQGENLINNYDFGRQVQLSIYSGPVPYAVGEQKPSKHWEHLGWNPVQTATILRILRRSWSIARSNDSCMSKQNRCNGH